MIDIRLLCFVFANVQLLLLSRATRTLLNLH